MKIKINNNNTAQRGIKLTTSYYDIPYLFTVSVQHWDLHIPHNPRPPSHCCHIHNPQGFHSSFVEVVGDWLEPRSNPGTRDNTGLMLVSGVKLFTWGYVSRELHT